MILITAPTVEPVTLTEVKSQLGITTADTASDTQLTRRITEARKWCETYLGRSLMRKRMSCAWMPSRPAAKSHCRCHP